MEHKKIVVIGSGLGGAAAAAILQTRGHDVTLLERNRFVGGKCWGWEQDGYIVDSGVHMFSMGANGPHVEVDQMVGGDQKWLTGSPGATFYFRGDYPFYYYRNVQSPQMLKSLMGTWIPELTYRAKHPVQIASSRKSIKKLANELHAASKRGGLMETLKMMKGVVKYDEAVLNALDDLSVFEFISMFTCDDLIHQHFSVTSTILTVTSYKKTSAAELMWCVGNQAEKQGLGVTRGGSREIPNSWMRSFERNGGKLVLGAEVKDILIENDRAVGVRTVDGNEYKADFVISNAGIKQTVDMAGEKAFPSEYVERVKGLEESWSFITVKYGVKNFAVETPAPCFFSVPNMDPTKMFDYIEDGGVPEDPFLFVPIPSIWDHRAAPLGHQLVMMGVPGPTDVNEKTLEQCERILDVGEQKLFEIFPKMEKNVEWRVRTTIKDTAALTGKPTGECIGIAQCVGQTGMYKPKSESPVKGLILAGCDAGARGVGTEQAASSGIYAATLVDQ